jgi:hypothetical protein
MAAAGVAHRFSGGMSNSTTSAIDSSQYFAKLINNLIEQAAKSIIWSLGE